MYFKLLVNVFKNLQILDFFIVKKTTTVGDGTETTDVFKINSEGTMVLGANTSAPTATAGGIYYDSTDDEFYLGTNN